MMLLDVANVKKTYKTKGTETTALRNIDFSVNEGEYVAIMGESGSGKSTLLNIIATFDQASEGKVTLAGRDLSTIKAKEVAQFRREELGFVFQDFNVLDTFSNKDNILLPLVLSNTPVKEMEARLAPLAKNLGIDQLLNKFPYEISGGQRQRVAIARALITQPALLLADEPTGALDSKSSEQILETFKQIHLTGNTILMVTHSIPAAATASRVLFIKDGVVYHELYRGEATDQEMRERIAESLTMLTNRGV
ncbi:ABC transporter ATP-binding protein [Aerococcaceae bacterium 50-4]